MVKGSSKKGERVNPDSVESLDPKSYPHAYNFKGQLGRVDAITTA